MDSTENDIVEFAVEKENNEKVKTRNEQLKDWSLK
ncbi:hypothetical protein RPO_00130 [Rickettsia rickettsii str. Arizona]|nr:hypothetical protein RrIowa_0031 [Rickettsia rickettsii str. Iowa]AFB22806.1 hypothetical protein RPN_06755 [Rickettsia rickettsii str. Brazil]AFB22958.1 hypothetical protein RPL_00135 [Rickettsia rickettsii str. Colombia]AFB24307.1 hypothetical protein RPO_00130 [Rickettsia rickettsii str. Arizona]AFB25646.1 hypothetical protein RSA_00110 [Rickettsia philipii str. 364D]AFB26995.1 hypothetical protein RPJ_00135 [Rickettsia rickettsii str. Hino]AFB29652.1 hypothetical protein RPM_00135 [Ric